MIICDKEIRKLNIISPYEKEKISYKGTSYGQSSFGYDVRLGNKFTRQVGARNNRNESTNKVSPLTPERLEWTEVEVDSDGIFQLEPSGFVLAHTMEKFTMPNNITGLVKDKSTYARLGIAVQNTVIEAGWEGYLTLEITNHSRFIVELQIGGGIAQIIFFKGTECEKPYSKSGKYQGQEAKPIPSKASTKSK